MIHERMALECTKFNQSVFLRSIQVVHITLPRIYDLKEMLQILFYIKTLTTNIPII